MKEQLIHILDQSVCLSRKQMKEYVSGAMLPEEIHAAEIHLNSCPLCSMAMEGFEQHSDEALAAIASLNSGFLKDHFDNIAPQIHLNSIAPAVAIPSRKRGNIQPLWRVAAVAAILLVAIGSYWYMKFGEASNMGSSDIAMAENPAPETREAPNREIVSNAAPAIPIEDASPQKTLSVEPAAKKKEPESAGMGTIASRAAGGNHYVPEPSTAASEPEPLKDVEVRATRAYQPPLIDPEQPGGKSVKTAETIEKSATRNVSDVSALGTQTYPNESPAQ